jgi:hypothetical protein
MWELNYPQLDQVAIEDFQFAAEYLTDGDFGLRQPETHQMKEAIAQCVSAWETANQLNMDDMLEHIAEKVKFLEWDNEDVLTLAILVYRVQGPLLDAHNNMRDWISSYLAHHFWTCSSLFFVSHIPDVTSGPSIANSLFQTSRMKRLATSSANDCDCFRS